MSELHADDPAHPTRLLAVAPCGCGWDGWACPHCGTQTTQAGDGWEPAHTIRCHGLAPSRDTDDAQIREAGR